MTAPVTPAGITATSNDGRLLHLEAADTAPVFAGDLVVAQADDGSSYLGQVLAPAGPGGPASGVVIGRLDADGAADRAARAPFHDASVSPASAEVLAAVQRTGGADLTIGTWNAGPVTGVGRLKAKGFNRHTFLCGQSGSGKTYALGVILEQLMLDTDLRMLVLDPNADFVSLGQARADTSADDAQRLGRAPVTVLRPNAGGGQPLRCRFRAMAVASQAAVLQLDPLADRDEYNLFIHQSADNTMTLAELLDTFRQGDAHQRALGQRIENLGLPQWEIWANNDSSAAEVIDAGSRVTVMDLGGFRDPAEPLVVALDVIEHLWSNREQRTPTLIVIDEAHNLCSAQPSGPVHAALTNRLIQIAAEGRKYGLWLLLSTQRPSKIHPQVLTQCDNLALMRMNSPGDVAELVDVFGFAPPTRSPRRRSSPRARH